jgi:hypothetical protein
MAGVGWAGECFPQFTKSSGVAAVLDAADRVGRDAAIFAELDAIDRQDEWEDG